MIRHPNSRFSLPLFRILFFPLSLVYLELAENLLLSGTPGGKFLLYIALFSLPVGLLCGALLSLCGKKSGDILSLLLLGFITVYFGTQLVFCRFFKEYFYWELLSSAGGALTDFRRETTRAVIGSLPRLIPLFLPFTACAIVAAKTEEGRRKTGARRFLVPACAAVLSAALFAGGLLTVSADKTPYGDCYLHGEGFVMGRAAGRFGLTEAMLLDTRYTLFGLPGSADPTPAPESEHEWGFETEPSETKETPGTSRPDPAESTDPSETSESRGDETTAPETEPEPPVDTSPQVMEIDFDSLIRAASDNERKSALEYFASRTPTNKNAYTGMFKGKNLIFITVEAWAPAAISEKMTPTLWKMKNEGFLFDNYYCSLWGGSTATGEYANLTGNLYRKATCLRKSGSRYEPFAPGNVFGAQGYLCCAFHNHKYEYYDRQLSHPNFGYEWRAVGNWDKASQFTEAWPRSDRELAELSLSYIPTDGSPFHFYYMTVSGHASQTFDGNRQSRNHRDEVLNAGLPYTDENALSYIAAQLEVEGMVKTLCDYLAEKGLLEDTVFVMAPDHYPYTIVDGSEEKNIAALSSLYGLPAEGIYTNPELYRAPLIVWSASMEKPVQVKKVCSAIDILPTVLNLFGAEYDSRLITGRDILSDCEGFVPLNMSNWGSVKSDGNWITDYGFYSADTHTFTPFPGVKTDGVDLKAYAEAKTRQLHALSDRSVYLLDKDLYAVVFGRKKP